MILTRRRKRLQTPESRWWKRRICREQVFRQDTKQKNLDIEGIKE